MLLANVLDIRKLTNRNHTWQCANTRCKKGNGNTYPSNDNKDNGNTYTRFSQKKDNGNTSHHNDNNGNGNSLLDPFSARSPIADVQRADGAAAEVPGVDVIVPSRGVDHVQPADSIQHPALLDCQRRTWWW